MWDFVDKVIYINLDHREDRRKIMMKFFEDAQIPLEKVQRFSAIKRSKGTLGCLESHTNVLRLAKKNKWKNVLILEDDLEWLGGYERLEELVKLPDWNVIMLVGWYTRYKFPRIFGAGNTGAYLVNEKYIDTFLRSREVALSKSRGGVGFNFNNLKFNADVHWNELLRRDTWYCLNPCVCRQLDGFSDIGQRVIESSKVLGIFDPKIKSQVYG